MGSASSQRRSPCRTSLSSGGLYTVPVNTATHPLTPVPNSSGLVTADWIDTPGALVSTTIIAADLAPGGLLTMINAASGARTRIAGTAGALDPMGQPDGSVLFVTIDGSLVDAGQACGER